MWPFKKKKQEINLDLNTKHKHVYKDFPWYLITEFDSDKRTASYRIVEPYVCILCGNRIDKTLEQISYMGINTKDRNMVFSAVKEKYKDYLKPRAIVEDMINNVLLVKDPAYLHTLETTRGTPHRGCGTSSKMSKSDFRINIERSKK